MVAGVCALALNTAGEHTEAVRLQRDHLDVRTRMRRPEHRNTLTYASNLAVSLLRPGECAEAAVLLRTMLAVQTHTAGPDDAGMLTT